MMAKLCFIAVALGCGIVPWFSVCVLVAQYFLLHGLQTARLLCPWDFPGKNTGVGGHSHSQGIFLTQGWNPGLLHCRQILDHLSHEGTPCSVYASIKLSWNQ